MKRILAAVAALFAALTFVVLAPAPAQALGWSGQRCDNTHTVGTRDGFKVCTQFHTVALANGKIWIDTVQECLVITKANSGVRNSFQNGWGATGGAWGGMPNVDPDSCSYVYPTKAAGSVGAGACYYASGRINRSLYTDTTWEVGGRVQGGAC